MATTTNHGITKTRRGQLNAQDTINNALDELDKCVSYRVGGKTNINADATATHTLVTVPTGKRLIVTQVIMRTVDVSSASGNPSIALGGNASSYNDFSANGARDLDSPGDVNNSVLPTGDTLSYAAGVNFSAKINTGGTATAMTIAIDVIGYFVAA